MTDYIRREVEFRAKVTETSTCTCAACHNVGRVVKLKLPKALYRDGILQAEYSEYWLCLNCRCAFKKDALWSRNYCPNCGAKMDGGVRT